MKKSSFLTLLVLFVLLHFLVSCTDNHIQLRKLQRIDSLMEKAPQAAYDSLCQHQMEFTQGHEQKVKMRYQLLKAKAENKLYLPMPSDSSFQDVVDYYDSKGTSNEKMEACYLMGCIFRDRKEAPKAMMWYNKAIECADTLSKKCDYVTLFSIYGQKAEVYSRQYLHREAINAYFYYSNYAARINDKENYILGFANRIPEYYALGDTLQAINLVKKCYALNNKYGFTQNAAQVLPLLIYTLLFRGQYQQAHFYMNVFETQSGLIDRDGNMLCGYEHYYKAKGMYYLGTNQISKAELYFRKLGNYGFKYEAAQGLLSLYRICQNNDSIKKYSSLCEKEMDSILNGTQANAVILANSLYNYKKLQQVVDAKKMQQERNEYIITIITIIAIFGVICLCNHYKQVRKRMKTELQKVSNNYIQTYKEMQKANEELNILQKNADILIKKKEKEIKSLQASFQIYKDKYNDLNFVEKKQALINSNIVQNFKALSVPHKRRKQPQQEDWEELFAIFQQCQPLLYENAKRNKLSEQEFRVCILSFLGMDNTEIAMLVNTTSKAVCNAKQKANKKMYNENTASSLYANLNKK